MAELPSLSLHPMYNKKMNKIAIVEQRGDKWVLLTKDRKKVLGTHGSAQDAYKQEYAIQKSQESMKKAARIISVFVKHANDIDAAAIYQKVLKNPTKNAPGIIENAKQFGVKGFPKFLVDAIIPKVEKNLDEYVQKVPTFNPQKVQDFIKKNPKIFNSVTTNFLPTSPVA